MSKVLHRTVALAVVLSMALVVPAFAKSPQQLTLAMPDSPGARHTVPLHMDALPVLAPSAALDLTILHTNDFHSHIDEFSNDNSACRPDATNLCLAGISRLATAIEDVRSAEPNVLLLDAGDPSQGSLYYTLFGADIITVTMNALDYDAMAIGNHEFDRGPAELARLINGANFPVLSANIDASGSPTLTGMIQASTVVTVSGERVGIVGVTAPETENISSPGPGIVFNDPATSLQAEINALTAQGIDKIIALTHIGYDADLAMAQVITGADVIVGGHSHTFIYTPTTPITFSPPLYPRFGPLNPAGPYPTVVQGADGNPVLIVTAYQWGTFLGRLDVSFDDQGIVSAYDGNPIFLANTIAKSPAMESIITPTFRVPVLNLMNTVVGTTTVDLPIDVGGNRICRLGECRMGNLVADAMLWRMNMIDPNNQYQIAIQNGGGLRSNISAGPVSLGEVMEVLPFGNTLATFELTGTLLIEALENGVSRYPAQDGRFPQVSGLRYTFVPSLPVGSRIVAVEVLSGTQYVPLNPNAVYKIVTNDFMRRGGDGYIVFRDQAIDPYDFGPALDEALAAYIMAFSPVSPEIEGRIRIINFIQFMPIIFKVTTP